MTYKCLKAVAFCFAGASVKLAQVRKFRPFFSLVAKMGVIVWGGPSGKRGNWGRELNRMLVLRKQQLQNAVFCKESFCFRLSDHCPRFSMAWKLAKWAKFVLVLTNTQMLKKSRISVNRISKVTQRSDFSSYIKAKLSCETTWFF